MYFANKKSSSREDKTSERNRPSTGKNAEKQVCQGLLPNSLLSFGMKEAATDAADWRKMIVSAVRTQRGHSPGPYELWLPRSRTSIATWTAPPHNPRENVRLGTHRPSDCQQ